MITILKNEIEKTRQLNLKDQITLMKYQSVNIFRSLGYELIAISDLEREKLKEKYSSDYLSNFVKFQKTDVVFLFEVKPNSMDNFGLGKYDYTLHEITIKDIVYPQYMAVFQHELSTFVDSVIEYKDNFEELLLQKHKSTLEAIDIIRNTIRSHKGYYESISYNLTTIDVNMGIVNEILVTKNISNSFNIKFFSKEPESPVNKHLIIEKNKHDNLMKDRFENQWLNILKLINQIKNKSFNLKNVNLMDKYKEINDFLNELKEFKLKNNYRISIQNGLINYNKMFDKGNYFVIENIIISLDAMNSLKFNIYFKDNGITVIESEYMNAIREIQSYNIESAVQYFKHCINAILEQ